MRHRHLVQYWVIHFAVPIAGAAALAAGPLRIEAEQLRVHSAGAAQHGVWNLWSNGELADFVTIDSDTTLDIRVRARGSAAAGDWPRMGIAIDGAVKDAVPVKSVEMRDYSFSVPVAKGLRKISVIFDNDLFQAGEDRNLYVDWIEIGPGATLGNPSEWGRQSDALAAAADESTLADARSAISRIRKGTTTLHVVDASGRAIANAPITVELKTHEFLFGCNIFGFDAFPAEAENTLYKKRFEQLFNYATTGFYWASYEPVRGKPNYAKTDAVLTWCAERGIRVKGHPLLWDYEAAKPTWAGGQPSADVQEARVREIVSRYKGKIDFWEVVNEPAHARGVTIDAPYRWAREANPGAHLIVNDYQVFENGYPPFFELLQAAIKNQVPFDGIGIQAHEPRTMRFPLNRIKATLDKYATLGKAIHITEFTPTSAGAPITGSAITGVWDEKAQAEYAEQFYTVCFAHPAVVAITWWDLCDAQSWLKGGGLLRDDLSPKPAYDTLMRLIRSNWHTKIDGRTNNEGDFSFNGFFGTYDVRTGGPDKALAGTVVYKKTSEGPINAIVSEIHRR